MPRLTRRPPGTGAVLRAQEPFAHGSFVPPRAHVCATDGRARPYVGDGLAGSGRTDASVGSVVGRRVYGRSTRRGGGAPLRPLCFFSRHLDERDGPPSRELGIARGRRPGNRRAKEGDGRIVRIV